MLLIDGACKKVGSGIPDEVVLTVDPERCLPLSLLRPIRWVTPPSAVCVLPTDLARLCRIDGICGLVSGPVSVPSVSEACPKSDVLAGFCPQQTLLVCL